MRVLSKSWLCRISACLFEVNGSFTITLLFVFLASGCYNGDDGLGCRNRYGEYVNVYDNSVLLNLGYFYNYYHYEFHEIDGDSAITYINVYKQEFTDFYVEGPEDDSNYDCVSLYHSGYELSADSFNKLTLEYFWHGYHPQTGQKDLYELRLKHHLIGEMEFTFKEPHKAPGKFDTVRVDDMVILIDYLGFRRLISEKHEMVLERIN